VGNPPRAANAAECAARQKRPFSDMMAALTLAVPDIMTLPLMSPQNAPYLCVRLPQPITPERVERVEGIISLYTGIEAPDPVGTYQRFWYLGRHWFSDPER